MAGRIAAPLFRDRLTLIRFVLLLRRTSSGIAAVQTAPEPRFAYRKSLL
jgi:hypothetical protein